MSTAEIDKLIAIKKKSDSSIKTRQNFQDEWLELVKTEGLNINTIKYLYEGFSFVGSLPLIICFKNNETALVDFMNFFISSDYADKNKSITSKLLLHMLALVFRMFPDHQALIKYLIKEIPYYCKDEQEKLFDNKVFRKYFLQELSADIMFPTIDTSDLNPFFHLFQKRINNSLDSIENEKGTKETEKLIICKVREWLSDCTVTKEQKSVINNKNNLITDYLCGDNSKSNKKQAIHETKVVKILTAEDYLNNIINSANNIEKIISCLQRDNENYIARINILQNDLNEQSNMYIKEKEQKQNIIAELAIANEKILKLSDIIKEQESQIVSKDNQIKNIEMHSSILLREKDVQNDVTINKISKDLKIEYKDFISALDCPMTSDLGENMREQLKSIFSILKNYGINPE